MEHACESQHERSSTRLIMTSFQPVFIMHSPFCCQNAERERERVRRRVERIRKTESTNGFISLRNTTMSKKIKQEEHKT